MGMVEELLRQTRHNPGLGMLPYVMQPWAATGALGGHPEAELLGELGEGVSRRPSCNPTPALGEEKRRSG
jgi:hypothetical protein